MTHQAPRHQPYETGRRPTPFGRAAAATLLPLALAAVAALSLAGCGSSSVSGSTPAAASSTSATASPAAALPPVQDFERDPEMKTTGIIGGVSWVSTVPYYRIMNEGMRDRFGRDFSAAILLYSIPFGEFAAQEKLAAEGNWKPLRATMVDAGLRLRAGGADFIIIASNTMNSTDDLVEQKTGLPVLRIQDPVGEAVKQAGITRVALLGTKYTMEEGFYRDRLEQRYGLEVVTPTEKERDYINNVIFDQLCADVYTTEARKGFVRIIERLATEEGAQGVILGCTEIPRLVPQKYVSVPVFDSTSLHAQAALEYALDERPID